MLHLEAHALLVDAHLALDAGAALGLLQPQAALALALLVGFPRETRALRLVTNPRSSASREARSAASLAWRSASAFARAASCSFLTRSSSILRSSRSENRTEFSLGRWLLLMDAASQFP